jgi:uncharacterized membrane protein
VRWHWRDEALNLGMLLAVAVCAAAAWPSAPERVPAPWIPPGDLTSRADALLRVPIAAALFYVASLVMPMVDPLRANYERFRRAYATIRTVLLAAAVASMIFTVAWMRGHQGNASVFFALVAGSLMLVLGNLLPQVRRNWFLGIRTPWTLSSELAWQRTHRLAGWLFVASGAVVLAMTAALPDASRTAVFATLVPTLIVSACYSYFVWRADPDRARKES